MATVRLGRYVFEEEPGRLQILDTGGVYALGTVLSSLLVLGGVIGSVALLALRGPAEAGWWLLATGASAILGIWLLSCFIATGKRPRWTIDRESGELLHRGKPFRSLASITHLATFVVEWPATSALESPRLMHYVEFAPRQEENLWLTGAGSWKELLSFRNLKDASQAATILSAFLGIRIGEEVRG